MRNPAISSRPTISVICLSGFKKEQAKVFAQENGLPLFNKPDQTHDIQLIFHNDIIELYDQTLNAHINVDFLKGNLAHRQQFGGGRGQAIAKAIGLKSGATPTVLDTTAGLAGDAFVLATLGCSITMLEQSPILSLLITDAIERASLNDNFHHILNQGFNIINQEANDYIDTHKQNVTAPEVIYIDPMYPERKKSALVKKDMQILQHLHLEDSEEDGQEDNPKSSQKNSERLLENALLFATKRVVVKRPIHADTLSERKPNTCIKSKKTRYDVYTIQKM